FATCASESPTPSCPASTADSCPSLAPKTLWLGVTIVSPSWVLMRVSRPLYGCRTMCRTGRNPLLPSVVVESAYHPSIFFLSTTPSFKMGLSIILKNSVRDTILTDPSGSRRTTLRLPSTLYMYPEYPRRQGTSYRAGEIYLS